jgi:hypothetical protein
METVNLKHQQHNDRGTICGSEDNLSRSFHWQCCQPQAECCPRLLQVLRLQTPRTQNRQRRRSMPTSTRSAGAAASVMFKLCCLLFLLIGDARWGCRTGLAREGAPGAEG